MHTIVRLLPLALYILAFAGVLRLLVLWERKQARTWKVIAEGEFDRVERGFRTETVRHGAMVHATSSYRVPTTIVVFTDGRTVTLRGRRDLPFTAGTRLRVLQNGLGGRRIERLDP